MGLLARLERRSYESVGHPRDPAFASIFGGPRATSGVRVDADSSKSVMAIYRAIRLLSNTIASLPIAVYERFDDGTRKIAPKHPLADVITRRPNRWQTPFGFKQMMAGHFELRGNAFARILADGRGRVTDLIPLHPDRVYVRFETILPEIGDTIYYEYRPLQGKPEIILWDEMLHWRGFSEDGLTGLSPIDVARNTIGLAIANQEYAARFFSNGAMPGGVLSHPKALKKEARDALRESWEKLHGGGPGNAHKVAVLEEGLTWTAIGFNNQQAQFLENRHFDIEEIARLFDLPPHKLMDLERSTNNNIEHQGIEYVMDAILPRAVNLEETMERDLLLPSDEGRYFIEANLEGLMRGDSAARGSFYNTMFNIGAYSPNDIRRKENENAVSGGDEYFVPLNMVPLSMAGQLLQDQTKLDGPAKATDPTEQKSLRAIALRSRIVRAHERLFVDAVSRMAKNEAQSGRRALEKANTARSASPITDWIDAFYPDHEKRVARALEPVMLTAGDAIASAAAMEVGLTVPDTGLRGLSELMHNAAAVAARAYVSASRAELRRILEEHLAEDRGEMFAAAFTDWDERRALRDGPKESRELANIVAAFVYRAAGVAPIALPSTTSGDPE